MITPTSPNVQDALQEAVDEGIKVVLIDNDIPDWDGKSSVVATDNLAGGKLAGEFMASQLEPGAKIAILQGVLGAPSLDDRVTGFEEGLGDGFEIVAKLPTDCDQTKGLDAAQDILTANPDLDRDLRRLWSADHRCDRSDRECRHDDQASSASTQGRTRSPPSSPAPSSRPSRSSPPRWASWAARLRSTPPTARRSREHRYRH